MACNKLLRLAFQNFSKRKFHSTAENSSNWERFVQKNLESGIPKENESVCIYRVPRNMLQVKPKAYIPNNISIGPYHHGAPHLRDMESLKMNFFRRLFDLNGVNGSKLDDAFQYLAEQESRIRKCYMGEIQQSSDEFLQMMLVDCSFIIQLLRDLSLNEFKNVPSFSRWMLPTIRRELIMLENQVPFFVLNKLFELTQINTFEQPIQSLNDLSFPFLYGLVQSDSHKIPECQKYYRFEMQHMLDLLRYNILPTRIGTQEKRGIQKQMIPSATELMESGVKIKGDKNRELLNIRFEMKFDRVKELSIPHLHISDRRGTVFRNIVAFEKCHKRCFPDVTTYLFFFNGLIKSVDDVALLHRKGVLDHSLGSNERVAVLIHDMVDEIVPDMNESYLYKVVNDANEYSGTFPARARAAIVHHYLTSWNVGISTIITILALYLTYIQTCGHTGIEPFESLFPFRHATAVRSAVVDTDSNTPSK